LGGGSETLIYENHAQDSRVTEGSVGRGSTYAAMTGQTGSNGLGISKEVAYTLNCANDQAVCYENHAQDSRVTESVGVCPTLHSQMGTGGNVPLVMSSGQANAEISKICPTLNCLHEAPILIGEEHADTMLS
jgi:hypothetical protein